MIARAVLRERTIAPRPTLRAEPVTINSRWHVWARIAAGCGFPATRATAVRGASMGTEGHFRAGYGRATI
jgi:hypothetical protein